MHSILREAKNVCYEQASSDLMFLKNKIVLYYAGLDKKSMPFGKSERKILRRKLLNFTYLKILLLVSDYVVVPPSFYIDTYNIITANLNKITKYITPFYDSGLLLSPIHEGFVTAKDFLEFKREGIYLPKMAYRKLQNFFQNIPVLHRNVKCQSASFRNCVIISISNSEYIHDFIKYKILSKIRALEGYLGSQLSRRAILQYLYELLKNGEISYMQYKNLYYIINKCYYIQGGKTYFANISLPSAYKYYTFGSDLFIDDYGGIIIGYDPLLVLSILRFFGIDIDDVDNMTVEDILMIRKSSDYKKFVSTYHEFVNIIQSMISGYNKISENQLREIRYRIKREFRTEYLKGERLMKIHYKIYNISFSILGFILGILCIFPCSLVGVGIGLIPTFTNFVRYKDNKSITDFILSRIDRGNKSFYNYIELIREMHKIMKSTSQ